MNLRPLDPQSSALAKLRHSPNADALSLLNGATGVFTSYFYSTSNNRWQRGGVDASNDIIRPDQCLQVERKAVPAVSFTLVGEVKLGPTEIMIQGGAATQNFNLVSNPYPLNSVTLAASGLFTGNPATGVVARPPDRRQHPCHHLIARQAGEEQPHAHERRPGHRQHQQEADKRLVVERVAARAR